MNKKTKVVAVKRVLIEDPFGTELSLREISRRTGLDIGYLSRVKNGEIAIGEENLAKILAVTKAVV